MAWIRTVSIGEATGRLKKEFDAALKRAGEIFNIVGIMSLNPRTLTTSMEFYRSVMFFPSPLSRRKREMLAVVVSATNHCHY